VSITSNSEEPFMSTARAALTVAAAFVVSQVLVVNIHGFILSADYEPFEGTLLRVAGSDQPPWQMVFLPVAHLAYVSAMVWLHARLRLDGSAVAQGLTLGLVSWLMSQVPLWMIWYAQQPWPGSLVVKQLGLELVAMIVIGTVIAAVARAGARAPAFRAAAGRPMP
jgi:hypothetical protein